MALTATASQGFELVGLTTGNEVFYLPTDPGVTYTKGDAVIVTNGVPVLATDSAAGVVGTVAETTVAPANTVGAAPWYNFNPNVREAADLCYVPIYPNVPAGQKIYEVTFASHFDDTLAVYATQSLTLTTSPGADDDTNAALIYVYAGPGQGEILIGDDYTHSTKVLIPHRDPSATLTTASKVLILEGAGSGAGGISLCFGRADQADRNNIDIADGSDDGDWMLFMDAITAPNLLQQLKLRVVRASAMII